MIETLYSNQMNYEDISQIAALTKVDVLLLGPPGSGKTETGYKIHDLSPRSKQPFITVNCAELSPSLIEAELFGTEKGSFTGASSVRIGKFEAATGGTLFFDEIGEIPIEHQAKFLKAIEEKKIMRVGSNVSRPIDVRLIFATNQSLDCFREDLKQRLLCAYPIEMLPLDQRKDEIPALVEKFVHDNSLEFTKSFICRNETIRQFTLKSWPGNIRELKGTIRHLCVTALLKNRHQETIEISFAQSLPKAAFAPQRVPLAEIHEATTESELSSFSLNVSDTFSRSEEKACAERFLRELNNLKLKGFNCDRAAVAMGLTRRTLFNRVKRYKQVLSEEGIMQSAVPPPSAVVSTRAAA